MSDLEKIRRAMIQQLRDGEQYSGSGMIGGASIKQLQAKALKAQKAAIKKMYKPKAKPKAKAKAVPKAKAKEIKFINVNPEKKKKASNPKGVVPKGLKNWIAAVKDYAAQTGMKYGEAVRDKKTKLFYEQYYKK